MLDVGCSRSACHPSPVTRQSERGVALVITLILLSVALVMTLAFLAISGHEQGSVTTQTDAATTRLAADAGLAVAEAQIAANLLASTNPYSFGLVVSTNYDTDNSLVNLTNLLISPRAPVWLTNFVLRTKENRFYLDLNRNGRDDPNGWIGSFDSNGNLLTNSFSLKIGDPEWIGILAHPDRPYAADNPFIARFAFFAMPAGNALDANAIHNQTLNVNLPLSPWNPLPDGFFRNQGVGSWEINLAAFLADLNTNQWGLVAGSGANPPAGSTLWYQYNRANPTPFANNGVAFNDAFMLLTNRYAGDYHTQSPVGGNAPRGLFTTAAVFPPFQKNIDAYSAGPLQTTVAGINVGGQNVTLPWAGADNTNRYFNPGDLYNIGAAAGFARHLLNISTNSTYDRYTLYRLLSQLGTDSTPETGKMNLNYDNLDPAANGVASQTNFVAWTPLGFFTNAADRLLQAGTARWAAPDNNTGVAYQTGSGTTVVNSNFVATFNVTAPFGVTGIPVWVSNRFVYTPAVQRLLQLAANTYDASTNSYFPSVFRPVFEHDGLGNVFISGYTQVANGASLNTVTGTGDPQLSIPFNIGGLTNLSPSFTPIRDANNNLVNVYGVPWIIGAKKGFPNFNEFVQENIVGVTRRLQVTRDTNYETVNFPKVRLTGTNQMYLFSLNSSVGLDFWNSYNSNFTDNVTVVYRGVTWMSITNDDGNFDSHPFGFGQQPLVLPFAGTNTLAGWPGTTPWTGGLPNPNSFLTPLYYQYAPLMMPSVYRRGDGTPGTVPGGLFAPCLIPTNYFGASGMTALFENRTAGFPLPHFGLLTTNRLQVFILDSRNGITNVIDYVQIEQITGRDLNAEIFTSDSGSIWNATTNPLTLVPYGVESQIQISKGLAEINTDADGTWQGDAEAALFGTSIPVQQASFMAFFRPWGTVASVSDTYGQGNGSNYYSSAAAPYAPTRYAVGYNILQANDPLVHYLASDLTVSSPQVLNVLAPNMPPRYNNSLATNIISLTGLNLGSLNYNYQPWGGNPTWSDKDPDRFNLAERDPLASQSDNWNFPTNKFPTAGWLGRVHRGTPWQTVYLKSPNLLGQNGGFNTWLGWTGNPNRYDAANAAPTADRLLFDLFTTAVNDNATRGTLSVNVGADQYDSVANPDAGLAAWSALFSGVVVPTPGSTNSYTIINPAGPGGVNSALGSLVTNINYTRNNFRNSDGLTGAFEHRGDILSVPLLSDQSPFLNPAQTALNSDALYEWLPQQVLSLLRVGTPRYVIYSYGQALKPAPGGVYLGSDHFGLVTNYQVVAETATRAVVRFDTARTNVVTGGTNVIIVSPPRVTIEQFNILPPD
jgi:hypothetical protein